RALECLHQFGERLREIPPESIRVVGTNTFRKARKTSGFLRSARRAIGHRVEVISGIEEARLIYQGVARNLRPDGKQRLVIDIGGGSTEVIIGKGLKPICMESLPVGCVASVSEYFPRGRITRNNMRDCQLAAMREFEPLSTVYRQVGWDIAVGASGTVLSTGAVLRGQGATNGNIRVGDLHRLRDALIEAGHVDKLDLPGLSADRAVIFPAGIAILLGAFEALDIERLDPVEGALREGILYDLLGRMKHEDTRDQTINDLVGRYNIDTEQARRVERTALALHGQVADDWHLDKEKHADRLRWAAQLHEVGLAIAHARHHKHGAYLIQHADMPGFSRQEQEVLAGLVLAQRRKLPMNVMETLPISRPRALSLATLLRIAVVLHRTRSDVELPPIRVRAEHHTLELDFPDQWLDTRPLSRVDLEQERRYLHSAGVQLRFH
ncbi:MAG: Ppx/GppA family phosphatase, partial [Rhodobacteraceae bacterium]|nr:Ppx/GppA family phosphatase [Paracoccaceae bacterium]